MFTKGTQVLIKEGLKRIEEINVGDIVFSSPQDGKGQPQYKKVLKVIVHDNEIVRHISGFGPNNDEPYFLSATCDQCFWVESKGWVRADALVQDDVLRKEDGSLTEVFRQRRVYRTEQEGIGWVSELKEVEGSYGTLFDYANYKIVPDDGTDAYLSNDVYESADPDLKVAVYGLEVEEYYTYFVNHVGIWVRQD